MLSDDVLMPFLELFKQLTLIFSKITKLKGLNVRWNLRILPCIRFQMLVNASYDLFFRRK
jgi:hypothetical protein